MKRYILALDQGTTSSRAILFDHQGHIHGSAALEYPQHYPHPGWVEHDPNEIWNSQLTVARKVLHDNHVDPQQVRAIGSPVLRSHTTVVSRWLAMPMARTCCGSTWLSCSTLRATVSWVFQISLGSCSTQPGWG